MLFNTRALKLEDFERPGHSVNDIPQDNDASDTENVETNLEALKGLITVIVENSTIEDKDGAIKMLTADAFVQQRFLENSFVDTVGDAIDPTAFVISRYDALLNSVGHTVLRIPTEKDMAQSSKTWHDDNRDGN